MGKNGRHLFTSESVTEGHPDKMCDQISDAILDAIIRDDPQARVACETATTTGLVLVLGEITTKTYIDFQQVVRETVRDVGLAPWSAAGTAERQAWVADLVARGALGGPETPADADWRVHADSIGGRHRPTAYAAAPTIVPTEVARGRW